MPPTTPRRLMSEGRPRARSIPPSRDAMRRTSVAVAVADGAEGGCLRCGTRFCVCGWTIKTDRPLVPGREHPGISGRHFPSATRRGEAVKA
jgi:hypothetical protein